MDIEKLLLRLPMISQAEDVVNFSDISLNSELRTIEKLSQSAVKYSKYHKIILMVDVGDLREGILPENVLNISKNIIKLPNIELYGLGVNLNCYGGVIPSTENLGIIVSLAKEVREKCSIELPILSGGNTGSLHLLESNKIPEGINHLRLGESIVRGFETSFGKKIPNTYQDIFTFEAEVIEIQNKPSMPKGEIGLDSFGKKPIFTDKGNMLRAIIACGKQDIKIDGLSPKMEGIQIVGGSSDHTILDITNSKYSIEVGDVLEFDMDYGAILMASTSEYVFKNILHG
jgi:predicted amino acid racemase